VLVYAAGVPVQQAIGVITVNSFGGFVGHLRQTPFDWKVAGMFLGVALAGMLAGRAFAGQVCHRSPAHRLRLVCPGGGGLRDC
jgi:uncharacterized membrane protein YfcA